MEASTCIYVSNLPNDITTTELFKLFDLYGDIQTIKIVTNHAHIEMKSMNDALNAIAKLNKIPWRGNSINVTSSRFQKIILSKQDLLENKGASYVNMSYTNLKKRINRSANLAPTKTIYVANILTTYPDQKLIKLFEDNKIHVHGMTTKQSSTTKCAFIKFQTIDQAINALVTMHNIEIADWHRLYCSIGERESQAACRHQVA
ncbi:Polypyrimidine tract-binding protein 1 [Frankliniella fusca]|uniref:Polypyrimidine tract-binding protein 1 n=1 Tax=Frankliniella fusca TaxID=407009 RepID=A0AAE1GXC6_9NEOP|nr:Polypyrimidine tract-binding protein 1 [Frankliniella fusca]